MKEPYNANPNYPMHRILLEEINHHLDEMFERYSRLLAFRMDFGWKQGSERSQRNLMDEMEGEIQHLMDVVFGRKMVIGYCWVRGCMCMPCFILMGRSIGNSIQLRVR